jgi:putative hydrolase of the HAD superfamily
VWTSVILDYGLVLCLPPTRGAVDRMAGVFGIDHRTFWSLYEKNRGLYDRGDLDGTEYWSRFASDAGRSIDENQVRSLRIWDIEMWSRLNEPLLRWARNLRSAGYRTAVLSNLHTEFTTHIRKNCPWLEHFDCPVFSSEVGCIKPDREIYEHCLRGLRVDAAEAIFLDDREANVRAAKEKGITALQYSTTDQLRKDLGSIGFELLPDTE